MPKNTPIRIIDSQKTRAASFLGGSATAGGTTDHGLLLGLADDDHIQYLRADGTRTLTGNMLVSASVTIDGVDISAHAADANAHHAQQHAITGTDHTVTGSQYQIVGLTSTNTLGLLTAASSPTANQVVKTDGSSGVTLVDLTVSSDLFMTGTLDFGTDTIAEDATYLQVAGSKAVKFNQNIGNANWTVYNAGGASFGGSVDIVGSGDLYVAGSLGGAGGVLKTSGNRVGIACVPDSQFALDVAGPARAQYFIGPHAIQLDNARMICHFDGAAPYNTNYVGISLGHMGQVGKEGGSIIYRPGKFGKAVQLAEVTTNLVTNPSFETNLTGWSTLTGTTVTRSTVKSYFGTYAALLNASGGSTSFGYATSVTNGTTYTASAWVLLTSASGSLVMDLNDKSYEFNVSMSTKNVWTRIVGTCTANASGSVTLRFYSTDGVVAYIDGVQFEAKAYCTPYCDGSLGAGHSWSGTANASTSARTVAGLYYDIKVLDPAEGTIFAWVRVDGFYNNNRLFQGTNSDSDFQIYTNSTGAGYFTYAGVTSSVGTLTARTWAHVCVTWSRATGKITTYLNGAQTDQDSISSTATVDATEISVGSKWGDQQINGLIDDFTILSTAIDATQVRAIYESNAPVFAESSTVSWVATPSGLVWADERGLWMRDTAGNSVLGVYGGAAATYNWGGFTMAPGDLLIGNNAVGSSAILWDQSAGTFGFYGAGSATAQASVSTDGSITAGAGALALNSSGIQITAPSSQSAVGSYKFLVTGKTITSGLSAYYSSGTDTYYSGVWSNSSNIGNITTGIDATIGGGGTVKIVFNLTNSLSAANTTTYTLSGGNIPTWEFGGAYVGIGVAPTRPFQVNGGVFAGGDDTGLAGYTQITNSTQGVSSGTGTIKVNGTTARNSTGWLKIYVGTSIKYVPYFDTVTG